MPRHVEQYVSPAAERAEEEARKAEIRAEVLKAAAAGRRVRVHPEEVRAAFDGHDDEAAELRALRQAAQERADAQRSTADDQAAIDAETKRVLAEWDADRRRKAEAEARKRLGIPAPKTT